MENNKPISPVITPNINIPGEFTAKAITINKPLIGLFAKVTCKITIPSLNTKTNYFFKKKKNFDLTDP